VFSSYLCKPGLTVLSIDFVGCCCRYLHDILRFSAFLNVLVLATVKKNSRSFFNFSAVVDWHQRHEFLKCNPHLVSVMTNTEMISSRVTA
jgi:hypothetical protein